MIVHNLMISRITRKIKCTVTCYYTADVYMVMSRIIGNNYCNYSDTSVRGDIMDEDKYFRAVVFHNGLVLFWTAGKLKVSCTIDMTFFPFDDQACYVHVDSWTYSNTQVNYYSCV